MSAPGFGVASRGVYPIAATPFTPDLAVDWASLDRLTDFYVAAGASGITILGILGEAAKLDPDESREIARRVISRAPVPVVVGVSNPSFAAMGRLAREAMDLGAAGVMIAGHAGLRSDEQIAAYFRTAVEAIGPETPWALQDYPLTLSVVLSVPVIARLMAEHPSCVMLKAEDWPGLEKISALRRLQAAGELRPFSILTANGGLFLDLEPGRGSDGAMTGYAFPDRLVALEALQRAGEREAAHDLFDAHLPMIPHGAAAGGGARGAQVPADAAGGDRLRRAEEAGDGADRGGAGGDRLLLDRLGRRDPAARI